MLPDLLWVPFSDSSSLIHSNQYPCSTYHSNQQKGSTAPHELPALYLIVWHFCYFLEGSELTAFTDHKPPTFTFAKISEPGLTQQQRNLAAISEYTTCTKHISGEEQPCSMCTTLSRVIINALPTIGQGIDFTAMAATQQDDQKFNTYSTSDSGLSFQGIKFVTTDTTLLCHVSTVQLRPIVPRRIRKTAYNFIHRLSHSCT